LFAAIGIGVVLAGPPVAGLNIWLNGLVERQGRDELDLAARRHIALSEVRITRAVTTLEDLAARGVDSCRVAHVDALRQTTFAAIPVKELSIVAPDGRTLCTDVGNQPDQRKVVTSEPLAGGSGYLLELVRFGAQSEQWLRIRRPATGGGNGVAALIPATLFVPQVSPAGGPLSYHARMLTVGGTLIAEAGESPPGTSRDDSVTTHLSSERYAIRTTMSASPLALVTNQRDLRALGAIASGVLALVILALSLLLPRRQHDNPIAEIEHALKAGQFVPYYQPIVDIRSGRLRGAEVLIRWRKPDGTIVPPASFIPLAESSGLIIEVTRALMRRVCQEAGAVLGARPHLKIGFNLTACHFANEEIVGDVRKIFKKSSLKLTQIVLEVTERQPIENLTETRRVVAALQGLGVKVAIDDVGTGHSGLSYMLKLGVDFIKIDKLFVDAIDTERYSTTIIETLVELARNMHMEIIAEGVETFEQVAHLRARGIRKAQGFAFSPPLPGASFLKLLDAADPAAEARAA
jgi:sensor c-di-GMP phosphodiesterase-like protein